MLHAGLVKGTNTGKKKLQAGAEKAKRYKEIIKLYRMAWERKEWKRKVQTCDRKKRKE